MRLAILVDHNQVRPAVGPPTAPMARPVMPPANFRWASGLRRFWQLITAERETTWR
jgi:hypothetical protein